MPGYFVCGLNFKLAAALAAHCSRNHDSVISAAEGMEAMPNLAANQDQPSQAAVIAPQRGGYGAARKQHCSLAGGRTPYSGGWG